MTFIKVFILIWFGFENSTFSSLKNCSVETQAKKSPKKLFQNENATSTLNQRSKFPQISPTAIDFDEDLGFKKKISTLPRRFNLDKIRLMTSSTFQRKTKNEEVADTTCGVCNKINSSNTNTSALVKVFVGSLHVDINYKTVKVSETMTAKDLITLTLQRCGFTGVTDEDYILCQVIPNNISKNASAVEKTKPGRRETCA